MPDLDVLVVEVVVSLSSLVIGVTKVVSDSFDRVATESEMDISSAEPSEAGVLVNNSGSRGIRVVMNGGAPTVPDLDFLVVEVVVSLSSLVIGVTMVVVIVVERVSSSDTSTTCSGGDGGGEAVAEADAATLGAFI